MARECTRMRAMHGDVGFHCNDQGRENVENECQLVCVRGSSPLGRREPKTVIGPKSTQLSTRVVSTTFCDLVK